jgi:serine/threonine protein kinase
MSDDRPADLSWIIRVVERFEIAWDGEDPPRIEGWLEEAEPSKRVDLLWELLRVECELRRRAGETPTAAEYLRRFPEYAAVVAAVLDPKLTRSADPGRTEPTGAARVEPGPSSQAATISPELISHPDYRIIRALGSGGMGLVYLAHNRITGRKEVLKVISRDVAQSPAALDRFLREIRAVARLQHPNIVTAYGAFRAGGSLVLAMEYVEGLDLARLVQAKGPLPVSHACYFVHQAALGLQHAHEAGLVHRDIKPSNIMLARARDRGIVKVLDFGLARASRELSRSDLQRTRAGPNPQASGDLTRAGEIIGTPAFIAPEQIADAPNADIRADIYSLGCTLYYLLSGRPPFWGTTDDILRGHRSAEAPPLNLGRPEVPGELAALVARMIAKEPDRRFQTPADVAAALAPSFRKSARAPEDPSTPMPLKIIWECPHCHSQVKTIKTDAPEVQCPACKTVVSQPPKGEEELEILSVSGNDWLAEAAGLERLPARTAEPKAQRVRRPSRDPKSSQEPLRPFHASRKVLAFFVIACIATGAIAFVRWYSGTVKMLMGNVDRAAQKRAKSVANGPLTETSPKQAQTPISTRTVAPTTIQVGNMVIGVSAASQGPIQLRSGQSAKEYLCLTLKIRNLSTQPIKYV